MIRFYYTFTLKWFFTHYLTVLMMLMRLHSFVLFEFIFSPQITNLISIFFDKSLMDLGFYWINVISIILPSIFQIFNFNESDNLTFHVINLHISILPLFQFYFILYFTLFYCLCFTNLHTKENFVTTFFQNFNFNNKIWKIFQQIKDLIINNIKSNKDWGFKGCGLFKKKA